MEHSLRRAAVRRNLLSIPENASILFQAFALTLLVICLCIPAAAQEYRGTVTGQVLDIQGNVIPNAAVSVTSPEQTYTGKSDGKGNLYIPFVQPGSYKIKVAAPEFKSVQHYNVSVDVSAKISQTFTLRLGTVNETVSVNENTLQLSTADASGGTVMDPEKVQNLPLNGRQVYMLLN